MGSEFTGDETLLNKRSCASPYFTGNLPEMGYCGKLHPEAFSGPLPLETLETEALFVNLPGFGEEYGMGL